MRIETKIILLFLFQVGLAVFLDLESFRNLLEGKMLKSKKKTLEEDLRSLASPIKVKNKGWDYSDTDELYFVPAALMKPEIVLSLGWGSFTGEWKILNISNTLQSLMIPEHSQNVFIFNKTNKSSLGELLTKDISNVIYNSAPFESVHKSTLTNTFLVFSKDFILSKKPNFNINSSEGLKKITKIEYASKFPMFKKLLKESNALTVFSFEAKAQYLDHASKSESFHDYMRPNFKVTSFLDRFAQIWISNLDYRTLISSAFCTTSSIDSINSYCIKIRDGKALAFFPAYFDSSNHFENATSLSGFIQRALKESIVSLGSIVYPRENINLEDSLLYTEKKLKCLKSRIVSRNLKENTSDELIIPTSLFAFSQDNLKAARSKDYSQVIHIKDESTSIKSGPILKRASIYTDDDNCEEITWYNIFHHSIFGSPRFCKE